MKTALLVFIVACSSAHADEWKPVDYWLLGAATTLLVVDWGQTRSITNETETTASLNGQTPVVVSRQRAYHEKNPILGSDPSKNEIDRYFAVALLGTVGLSYVLPPTYRHYFLGGVIALETFVVLRNHRIGMRIQF